MKFKSTISFKVLVMLVIINITIMFAFGLYTFFTERNQMVTELSNSTHQIAERLSNSLTHPMWNLIEEEVNKMIDYEMDDKDIQAIIVTDDSDKYYSGKIRENGDIIKYELIDKDRIRSKTKNMYMNIKKPINKNNEIIGYVEVFATDKYINQYLMGVIRRIVIQTVMLSLVSMLIIFIMLRRIVLYPIVHLRNVVKNFSEKKFTVRSKINKRNELGELSNSINTMADIIQEFTESLEEMVKQRTKELSIANSELKDMNMKMLEDLHMAQKVQLGLIPDQRALPKLKKLHFGTKYLAMESIGGDLYDVINLGNGQYAFFIADVSGHGVPAALISTMVKVAFNSYAITGNDPADVCKNVNERMCQFIENLDYDLTAFYAVIDTKKGVIQFTNAAHHPAYIYRNSTKDIIVLQELNGYIGLIQDLNFTSKTEVIQDGDKIILFTDGVIEAENDKGDIYDMNRFESYIQKFGHLPAESFVAGLVSDVDKFCGSEPKKDDIAILCMDYYSG